MKERKKRRGRECLKDERPATFSGHLQRNSRFLFLFYLFIFLLFIYIYIHFLKFFFQVLIFFYFPVFLLLSADAAAIVSRFILLLVIQIILNSKGKVLRFSFSSDPILSSTCDKDGKWEGGMSPAGAAICWCLFVCISVVLNWILSSTFSGFPLN